MNTIILRFLGLLPLIALLLSGCAQTTGTASLPPESRVSSAATSIRSVPSPTVSASSLLPPVTANNSVVSNITPTSGIASATITTSSLPTTSAASIKEEQKFVLTSPEVTEGGMLAEDYTCDGTSATLPLEWSGAPEKTQSFALVMYTIPSPNESHWYWVLYNIPANVTHLDKNVTGIGTLGNNSVNRKTEYAPPCSKGPGTKLYTYTLYALSAPPQFAVPPDQVSRDILLSAIQDRTLTSAELNVYYSR